MKLRVSAFLLLLASALTNCLGVFVSCELGLSTDRNMDQQIASAIDYSYSVSLDKINGAVLKNMSHDDFSEWWLSSKSSYDDKNGNILSALYSQAYGNGFTLRYGSLNYPISICEAAVSEAEPRFSTHHVYSVTADGWTGLDKNEVFIGKSIAETVFGSLIKTASGFNYEAIIGTKLSLSTDEKSWEEFTVGGVYYDSSSVTMDVPGRFFTESLGNTFFVSSSFAQQHQFANALITFSSKASSCFKHFELGKTLAQESNATFSLLPKIESGKTTIDLQGWSDSIYQFYKNRESWWHIALFSLVLFALLPSDFVCALVLSSLVSHPKVHRALFYLLPAWILFSMGLSLICFNKLTLRLSSSYFISFLTPMGVFFSVLFAGLSIVELLVAVKFSSASQKPSLTLSAPSRRIVSVPTDQITI